MVFQIITTIIIVNYLRKSMQMPLAMPVWNKRMWWFVYVGFALLVLHFSYKGSDVVTQWLALLLLGALLYIINDNEEFKRVRFLSTAIIPYLVVNAIIYLITAFDPQLYNRWQQWLEAANTFAVIWGFGTWFVTKRQRKELAQAHKKAIEEEENNKVITAMKAQLEVLVAERTQELTQQKEELELALKELKATQSLLIQSEKMASLGELTAGIAHEIQNPLNFVNNFSEVSNELIDEMKVELKTGNQEVAIELADAVKQNLEKILHHGKRADAIVKGMLQHSRASSGQIEPTDINALVDEYLRLAFHGLRAKDKSFNAEMKTDFDKNLPEINLITQDIGRMVLNLITNAFYAVTEKKNASANLPAGQAGSAGQPYEPTVSVGTKKSGNKILITVSDNGNGIPPQIIDKIFQPFFTTKPSGQGTGLGLSLSYDIVKAHGGKIKVESKENEGTTFTIELPVS